MTKRLGVVPDEPRVVSQDEFQGVAREHWLRARSAYANALCAMGDLNRSLNTPGLIQVNPRTVEATAQAKCARDALDWVVVELESIITAAKETR